MRSRNFLLSESIICDPQSMAFCRQKSVLCIWSKTLCIALLLSCRNPSLELLSSRESLMEVSQHKQEWGYSRLFQRCTSTCASWWWFQHRKRFETTLWSSITLTEYILTIRDHLSHYLAVENVWVFKSEFLHSDFWGHSSGVPACSSWRREKFYKNLVFIKRLYIEGAGGTQKLYRPEDEKSTLPFKNVSLQHK